jgi:hypothetical protein
MKCIYNNKEIEIEVIGGFKIEELNKEYVLCVYDDNKDSDKVMMSIMEINDGVLVSIPDEEKEIVLDFYQSFKESIIGGE